MSYIIQYEYTYSLLLLLIKMYLGNTQWGLKHLQLQYLNVFEAQHTLVTEL